MVAVNVITQRVPLGFQWPTVDPFLFCVHHLDHYPAAGEHLGPNVSLAGRNIGQDFEGIDGWRMYHGSIVPGFPAHPHRGFETITYVRRGLIDHSDSLGAAARYGRGDVQWMTAGSGIVHAEMFPLLDRDDTNTLELFQIWINLPARNKMAEPYFSMFWDHDVPRLVVPTDGPMSPTAEITVIAGSPSPGVEALSPPPDSWAADPSADVALWHLSLDAGSRWTMPAAHSPETIRVIYLFDDPNEPGRRGRLVLRDSSTGGSGSQGLSASEFSGESLDTGNGAVLRCDSPVEVSAADGRVEALVLQGRPIGEPVARYGPFVMNTDAEIQQAFSDYRRTQFGGWPWPADDPTHGVEPTRFARHADGRVEQVTPA